MDSMKTNDEIRRDNLLIAITRMKTAAALAEKAHTSPAYLSQVKNAQPDSKTGVPKHMGDDIARRIEAALGEPEGWIDTDHTSVSNDLPISALKGAVIKETPKNSGDSIPTDDSERGYKNVVPALRDQRHIPIISYVQAGKMTEVVDPFSLGYGFDTIQPTVECSKHSFALTLDGDSMEPRFHDGDVVIIDPEREPKPGNFVVAKNGKEEATFKKYRPRSTDEQGNMVFELVPLNDDYPTLHSDRDHLRIIGVCVERREIMV